MLEHGRSLLLAAYMLPVMLNPFSCRSSMPSFPPSAKFSKHMFRYKAVSCSTARWTALPRATSTMGPRKDMRPCQGFEHGAYSETQANRVLVQASRQERARLIFRSLQLPSYTWLGIFGFIGGCSASKLDTHQREVEQQDCQESRKCPTLASFTLR